MIQEIHGMRVRSSVPIPGAQSSGRRTADLEGAPDLDVRWGESKTVPFEAPPGRVLAAVALASGPGSSHAEQDDACVLRYHGVCDFRFVPGGRSLSVHRDPATDPEVVSALLSGSVIAFILSLQGHCVLHASAVDLGGVALSFVGGSGVGKSTLAAAMCAGGAAPFADDVLRLDAAADGTLCYAGTSEIRLRAGGEALAARVPGTHVRGIDGRTVLKPPASPSRRLPVRAFVLPRPSRKTAVVRARRLRPRDALLALIRYPRVQGWQVDEPLRRQFDALATVARVTPVYEMEVPWGPPFDEGLASAIRAGLEAADAAGVEGDPTAP